MTSVKEYAYDKLINFIVQKGGHISFNNNNIEVRIQDFSYLISINESNWYTSGIPTERLMDAIIMYEAWAFNKHNPNF